ncbi:MAG: hypothetical protein ACE5MI_10795 [Acidimicrobiia bacterium]
MRSFLDSIPRVFRWLLYLVITFVALLGLVLLFETAGGIIDTGGVVGP